MVHDPSAQKRDAARSIAMDMARHIQAKLADAREEIEGINEHYKSLATRQADLLAMIDGYETFLSEILPLTDPEPAPSI